MSKIKTGKITNRRKKSLEGKKLNPKPQPKKPEPKPAIQPLKPKAAEIKTTLIYADHAYGKPTEYLKPNEVKHH